ncbi:DNA processing/uptake protein [Spiroplasma clarkii]|uniref:hypothetical protein n=1 Tax=Spiroplasma clarkii TaxID=2139 RepID=UPI000B5820DB|nr:hypothetical protein [Spiroplasma clarkii]ARU91979.1 DNA processing/uptake protein [Spiroplasma clarkii]
MVIATFENEGLNNEIINYCRQKQIPYIDILKQSINSFIVQTNELEVSDQALVISEIYNFNVCANRDLTDRLVSSMCAGVLFTQFVLDDRYENLLNFCLNQGKEIFVTTFNEKVSDSTELWLKNGAKIVNTAKDIIHEL